MFNYIYVYAYIYSWGRNCWNIFNQNTCIYIYLYIYIISRSGEPEIAEAASGGNSEKHVYNACIGVHIWSCLFGSCEIHPDI